MLPVVQEYLAQCGQRRVEPYYGFIEHAGAGNVVTDLDFALPDAVRLFALALLRVSQRQQQQSEATAKGSKLNVLALRYDMNKGPHHPPRQSKRKLPYETLLARRRPAEAIVALQNRAVVRSLVDGVR
ncbi:hypothetical protein DQ04_06261000, partial [Trypanosoma grayi]|uniref:hypothetical protein n=1 Tax=Trypanosoma grayi TaxID=71804 RepID=UPI0004F4AFDC